MAVLFSRHTLLGAGKLGAVYADLQDALLSQKQGNIDAAQAAAEELLVELLPGHVSGQHIGVAELWEVMASVDGSTLGLGCVATGRCGCGKSGPRLPPSRMQGWQYNNAVSIGAGHLAGGLGVAAAVEFATHNLKASAAKFRSSQCCGTMAVFDLVLNPAEVLCILIHPDDNVGEAMPKLGHLRVNGWLFWPRAVIIRDAAHYTAYFHAARLEWLNPDGWYYYDGMRTEGRLQFVGPGLCIDKRHAGKVEMVLFTRAM